MSSYLDAITALGNGSLHPGGFSHTLEVLRQVSISSEHVVLDIGCGTGRTACYLSKTFGAHVFALDSSEKMLHKAKVRASREGADVHFVLGDALEMPFQDSVADFMMIESVLIFLPIREVLKECFRVLKKNAVLVDIEMLALETLPPGARERLKEVCGLPQIPTLKEWIDAFNTAGFAKATVKQHVFPGFLENFREMLHPDPYRVISEELGTDRELNQLIGYYKELITRNRRHLGFGTFIVSKG